MTGIEVAVIAGQAITLADVAIAASTLAATAGAVQQGQATRAANAAQAQQYEYQARLGERAAEVKEQEAGQARASSQREAVDERKQGERIASRVQAVSAASGGGALDPTVIDILGRTGAEGEYRALSALYGGEERARGLEYGAAIDRSRGSADLSAATASRQAGRRAGQLGYLSGAGTLLEGGAALASRKRKPSMRDKYAGYDYLAGDYG